MPRFFDPEVMERLPHSRPDIVVGIPSFNNESTIGHVARTVDEGIVQFFDGNGLIVNADGGSSDATRKVFEAESTRSPKLSLEYSGVAGKGSAMGAVMELADVIDAKLLVFVDSDLRSIEPWWIERLAKPVEQGKVSYVTPYYVRHKFDGTITNNLCYPLTSALYGKRIRQPIGGDFGLSVELARIYLGKSEQLWKGDVGRFGIDIFMTTVAINESRHGVGQAALGAKIHDVKDPGKHLGPMFSQVVSTLLRMMWAYQLSWMQTRSIEDVPVFGEISRVEPQPLSIDVDNLVQKSHTGITENRAFYDQYFPEELKRNVLGCNGQVPLELWVDVVLQMAMLFRNIPDSAPLIQAMIPLYFGRVADFAQIALHMNPDEAEKVVEGQVEVFARGVGQLRKRFEQGGVHA